MSDLHERQMALDIWGRVSRNSGAGLYKGDVFNKDWVVEGKSSLDPKMEVSAGLINEAVREARTRHKKPVVGLAWLQGDPALPRGLSIGQHCYLVPTNRGPKGPKIKSLKLDLSVPVEEKTYRFVMNDPRVSEWWKLIKPSTARKLLGKLGSRLD